MSAGPSPEALREFRQAIADDLHRRYQAREFIPREPGRPIPPGAQVLRLGSARVDDQPVGDD